jgi:Rrf2 family transcriptional regulator, iron-sulfur cluster assembly transcription factor
VELSTKGRYAVMAMVDLAARRDGEPADGIVALSLVAERQKLPLAYLEQIAARLRRAGLIESERGRGGGYRLARPAVAISIAEILHAVDEDLRMTRCGIEGRDTCQPGEHCSAHHLWSALGRHIDAFLTRVTLADVVEGTLPQVAAPAALFSRGLSTGGHA